MKLLGGTGTQNGAGQSAVELLTSEAEVRHSALTSGVTPGKYPGQGVRPRIPQAGTDTPGLRRTLQNLERTPSPLRVWILKQSEALLGVNSH